MAKQQILTYDVQPGSAGTVLYSNGSAVSWVSTGSLGISGGGGGAAAINVTNDASSNSTFYPIFSTISSGVLSTATITTSKLTWNPSTGILSVVDINTTSDLRQKTNVQAITDAVSLLTQINGVSFDWLDSGNHSYGVIAQQLETVLPELVSSDQDGMKTVRYLPLIAILIEAVKQLSIEIRTLKNQ
jgi:hypothetical protein